jgi:hypothetical protein
MATMPTIFKHPVARRIAVVAALGLGLWGIVAWHGEHITECGVDANGPYAKVGYNSFGDGLVKPADPLRVDFYYDGAWYSVSGGSVKISVLGSTTTFVRGIWPPGVVNLGADGGPRGKITVSGRVVGGLWVNTGRTCPPGSSPSSKRAWSPTTRACSGAGSPPPVTDISTLRHSELVSPQCPLGGLNPRAAMLRVP